MKGIRKKISLGFGVIALLLAFSGMISLFEAHRLEVLTQQLDRANEAHVDQVRAAFDRMLAEPVDSLASRNSDSLLHAAIRRVISTASDGHEELHSHAVQMRQVAYRAIMPGVMALGVAILVLGMFYLMIDLYFVRPVIGIDRGLKGWLASRLPFKPTIEGRDEVHRIKESIDTLIDTIKKQSK